MKPNSALTAEEIRLRRLAKQHLLAPTLEDPAAVVSAMGAMQAQEYPMALWAVGLRTRQACESSVRAAIDTGRIVRLHALRPTWHFVAAKDVRMVLQVTAPRVHQANASYYRRLGLDRARLDRFMRTVDQLLSGGKALTRKEIRQACPPDLVEGTAVTMAYLMMYAELEGVVCSGPHRGSQGTYALLEERVPGTAPMSDEEALAQFVRRYLSTRGPATLVDLTTWSGLTLAQARTALDLLGGEVTTLETGGQAYHLVGDQDVGATGRTSFLMPDYDEYGMAYQDRSAIAHPSEGYWLPWNRPIVIDGVIAGAWRRTLGAGSVTVETQLFDIAADDPRVVAAAEEYAMFLGKELDLQPASG